MLIEVRHQLRVRVLRGFHLKLYLFGVRVRRGALAGIPAAVVRAARVHVLLPAPVVLSVVDLVLLVPAAVVILREVSPPGGEAPLDLLPIDRLMIVPLVFLLLGRVPRASRGLDARVNFVHLPIDVVQVEINVPEHVENGLVLRDLGGWGLLVLFFVFVGAGSRAGALFVIVVVSFLVIVFILFLVFVLLVFFFFLFVATLVLYNY
jgi:hypothetical protein